MAATDRSDRIAFALGGTLLALYIAQACLHLAVPPLVRLQQHETYKVVSGCVLGLYLWRQALMNRRRLYDPLGVVAWHKVAGACAPLVLYLHASRFAYGYLFLLSIAFLSTIAIGLLHNPVIRSHAKRLYTWWLILHIATASGLLVLGAYHALIALAYE